MTKQVEIKGHVYYGMHREAAFYDGKVILSVKPTWTAPGERSDLDIRDAFTIAYRDLDIKPVVATCRTGDDHIAYWVFDGTGWNPVDHLEPTGDIEYWLCTENFEDIKQFVPESQAQAPAYTPRVLTDDDKAKIERLSNSEEEPDLDEFLDLI